MVKNGRYHYIETGSLISIKKNVKDILIPSEEMKIQAHPMDYEEFCDATGQSYSIYFIACDRLRLPSKSGIIEKRRYGIHGKHISSLRTH